MINVALEFVNFNGYTIVIDIDSLHSAKKASDNKGYECKAKPSDDNSSFLTSGQALSVNKGFLNMSFGVSPTWVM